MRHRLPPIIPGFFAAILTLAADQANKHWLIFDYGIENRQPWRLTAFFDIIYAKNTGISYSLLTTHTEAGRLGLLALSLSVTVLLSIWLWRCQSQIIGLSLGLIIGGALGNAYDRFAYGYVADFYHFHVGGFSWYIFNLADVAIVAGVFALLLDSFFGKNPKPSYSSAGKG